MMTLEEALVKIERLRVLLREARQSEAMRCCECGGYSLCLAEGAHLCRCLSEPDRTEGSK